MSYEQNRRENIKIRDTLRNATLATTQKFYILHYTNYCCSYVFTLYSAAEFVLGIVVIILILKSPVFIAVRCCNVLFNVYVFRLVAKHARFCHDINDDDRSFLENNLYLKNIDRELLILS